MTVLLEPFTAGLPRSARDERRRRCCRAEVVEGAASVRDVPVEAAVALDDQAIACAGHLVEDDEVVAGLAVRARSVTAALAVTVVACRAADEQREREEGDGCSERNQCPSCSFVHSRSSPLIVSAA